MVRPLSLLLTLVLLAHSLAGCCSHHAHAAGAEGAGRCCESHEHAAGDADQDGHNGVPDDGAPLTSCDEGSCIFLRDGGSTPVDLGLVLAPCWAILNEPTSQNALTVACTALCDAKSVAPPTRLHLLNQILLI